MRAPVPTVALGDGRRIPQFGLGLWRMPRDETESVVAQAFELGYRHIDTAQFYENEAEVGRAIAASGIARDELFITTKLWISDHHDPRRALEASLGRLGLERVDLYLIHWPVPLLGTAVGAWRGLVELADAGLATSVGVSNFEIEHLEELAAETGMRPAVNQIELHPRHQRRELRAYCATQGIAIEAWSPLGQARIGILEHPEVVGRATRLGRSPAQIVLRWHLQHGTIVFPKSSRVERMAENLDVFDFALTEDDMTAIDALDERRGLGIDPRTYIG